MEKEFITVNIKEYLKLGNSGEKVLEKLFAEFECTKNEDVERFLLNKSIDFAKKNQSITYLVLNPINGKIVGYFTLAIKAITVSADKFSKSICKKFARISEQNYDDGTYTMPAYLIAQLGKNCFRYSDNSITGNELLSIALDKIKTLQFQIGGVVVFWKLNHMKN